MPIYEYRCEKCGDFEQTQRITDPALDRCPTCRRKVRRLISNTSFQLKGSGWYVTDYARAGRNSGRQGFRKGFGELQQQERIQVRVEDRAKSESKTESKVDSKAQSKGEAKAAAS